MSIEAEANANITVVEVEVTTAPTATVSVGGSTAAPVSSAPAGDAVVEGPQSVTVVSGPMGPPGPIGSGELEMRVDGAYTLIRQETTMRASADEALASRATTFETQLGEFGSSLTELETSYSTLDGAFAALASEVAAARDGEVSLLARITEVNEARVSGDQALATSISEQTVIVGNHTTAIGTLTQSYADLNTAYGLVQTEIEAARAGSGSLLARLTTLDQARVDGDTALASRASSLEAEVDAARNGQSNLAARIAQVDSARITGDEALAGRSDLIEAEITGARGGAANLGARLLAAETARTTADEALALRASTIEAEIQNARAGSANLLARLGLIDQARVSGDEALATRASVIEAEIENARGSETNLAARIGSVETASANADEALSSRASSLEAEIAGARGGSANLNARLGVIDTARVNGDSALATRATNLETEMTNARNGQTNLNARLGQIDTARVNGDTALASRATALEAEISGAKAGQASLLARLTQIDQARVDGDAALSSTITTVEAKANSATASGAVRLVSTAAPSGVSALYEWEIVAGAKKTGMRAGVMSSGAQPGFIEFETEAFRIRNSSGVPTPVFEVTGGQVYINGSRLPLVDDLPPPFAGYARSPYHIAFDDRGRITDAEPAFRLRSFDLASGRGVGAMPFVVDTAVAPGGGFEIEAWDFVVSTAVGRGLIEAENATAARGMVGAQAAHARLTALTAISSTAPGAVPYIYDLATPPGGGAEVEVWDAFATSSLGRSLVAANDAAAARALIGAAATGGGAHTHAIADVTGLQAALDTKLAWSAYTAADVRAKLLTVDGAGSGVDADLLDGLHLTDIMPVHSSRNFPLGTLIRTDIATSASTPFLIEINGNAYSTAGLPFDIALQGYIYQSSIIAAGGYSNGASIAGLSMFSHGGNLCLWFPSQSYWQGFRVGALVALAGEVRNRVVSIFNEALPTSGVSMEVTPVIRQSWHSGNFDPATKAAAVHNHSAADLTSGTLADARLPAKVTALGSQYVLKQSVDAQGRVTGYAVATTLQQLDGLGSAVGQIPYVSAYSAPNADWGVIASTALGRTLMAVANEAAGRTALGLGSLATLSSISNANWSGADLAVANGGTGASDAAAARANLGAAAASHVHAAGDITTGTLADARLPAKVTALGAEYPLLQSVDAQGRVTSYRIATNLQQLEGFGSAAGQVPYVAGFDAPNVTWGAIGTGATGRGLMGAATAAAARSTLGAAAASHTHAIADVTALQTALDAKLGLAGGTLTGAVNWSGSGQSTALVRVRRGGNSIEFGHENPAGFGSTIGCDATGGAPFLAFSAEAGTNNATYRTRGKAGSLFRGDLAGGFTWETVSTTTGDNLASTNLASLSAAGTLSVRGDVAALYNLSAGMFSTVGASNGFLAGSTGFYSSRNTTALAYHLSIYNPNGNVGGVTTSGTVTTFATSSDHRRKFDIEPLVEFELTPEQFEALPNALLRVMLLQPSSYRRVEEPGGPLHHGFIAHELQAVMPHAVVGDKDAVDADGGEILQLVDHSKLVTDTIAGLQGLTMMMLDHFAMLSADNDDRFAAIENRLDQLEAA